MAEDYVVKSHSANHPRRPSLLVIVYSPASEPKPTLDILSLLRQVCNGREQYDIQAHRYKHSAVPRDRAGKRHDPGIYKPRRRNRRRRVYRDCPGVSPPPAGVVGECRSAKSGGSELARIRIRQGRRTNLHQSRRHAVG